MQDERIKNQKPKKNFKKKKKKPLNGSNSKEFNGNILSLGKTCMLKNLGFRIRQMYI